MDAKIQKEFVLTVGNNEEGKTENDLVAKAAKLEQFGNEYLGVRFHIFTKEEKEIDDEKEEQQD